MILGIVVAVVILAGVVALVLVDARPKRPRRRSMYKPEYLSEVRHRRTETQFWWLNAFIGSMGVFGALIAAFYAAQAFKEGREQTKSLEDQVEAMHDDQRPWIKVSLNAKDLQWHKLLKPLSDDLRADQMMTMTTNVTVENVGRSAAFNVRMLLQARPTTTPKNLIDWGKEAQAEHEIIDKLCKEFSKDSIGSADYDVLFPAEKASKEMVPSLVRLFEEHSSKLSYKMPMVGKDMKVFELAIVGCVTYQFGTPLRFHRTPIQFNVLEIGGPVGGVEVVTDVLSKSLKLIKAVDAESAN